MAALSLAHTACFPAALAVAALALTGPLKQAFAESNTGGKRAATALLRVHSQDPVVLEQIEKGAETKDYEVFRNTQIALVKSPFVLEAALRPQEIAEIPQIRAADDPLQWVRERLHVDFPGNSEIMRVRLVDDSLDENDLTSLVDSIVDSFIREAVDSEQVEKLRMKDVLQRQFDNASERLNADREAYIQLAEELGGGESPFQKIQADMALERWRANRDEYRELRRRLAEAYIQQQLDLVHAGALILSDRPRGEENDADDEEPAAEAGGGQQLVAVDEEQLDAETRTRVKRIRTEFEVIRQVNQARMVNLEQDAQEIEGELKRLSGVNAELQARRAQLDREAELVDRMGEKLALWNVELAADSRVQPLQPAVIDRQGGD